MTIQLVMIALIAAMAGGFAVASIILTLNAALSWIDQRGTFATVMRAQAAVLAWCFTLVLATAAVSLAVSR